MPWMSHLIRRSNTDESRIQLQFLIYRLEDVARLEPLTVDSARIDNIFSDAPCWLGKVDGRIRGME